MQTLKMERVTRRRLKHSERVDANQQQTSKNLNKQAEKIWCQNALLKTITLALLSTITITNIECSPQNGLPASIMSHLASGSGEFEGKRWKNFILQVHLN